MDLYLRGLQCTCVAKATMSADTKTKTTALFMALVCPSALIVESTKILNELSYDITV
jgi:hypothetical protein